MMLKFKNSAILKLISKRSLKANKARNLVSIAAIILTTGMFTSLFTLALSQMESLNQMYMMETGTKAHLTFKNIAEEDADKIRKDDLVKAAGFSTVVGIAENEELTSRSVEIRYADSEYIELGFASPTTGRLPESEDEIAIDTLVLDTMGISHKVGETIILKWHDDYSMKNYSEKRFTIVGFWTGSNISQSSMAWVSKTFIDVYYNGIDLHALLEDNLKAYTNTMRVMLTDKNNIGESAEKIIQNQSLNDVSYGVNWSYESGVQASSLAQTLSIFGMMILVFISGYLIIYNIFQISVSTDIRFYGMLKTLGVTQKNIKKIIYNQAIRLSSIAIPIGLILGYGIGVLLLPYLVSNISENSTRISINPIIFIGSGLFAYLTVLMSCNKPIKKAKKISPIEALKFVGEELNKKQKISTSGAKLAHMAFSNLGRNKKRSAVIVCSISLGMVLLSFVYATNACFDIDKYVEHKVISDFSLKDSSLMPQAQGNKITSSVLSVMKKMDGVTSTGTLYYEETFINLSDDAYEDIVNFYEGGEGERYNYSANDKSWKKAYEEMKGTKLCSIQLYGIEGLIENLLLENNLINSNNKVKDFANGNYIIAYGNLDGNYEQEGYHVGDTVLIEGVNFELVAVCDIPMSLGRDETVEYGLQFFISSKNFLDLFPNSDANKFFFNVDDVYMEKTETILREYTAINTQLSYISRNTVAKDYKESTRSQTIIGQAMGIIIACIGVLNFLNTMSTSIITRKKEFAVMQSIGMTTKQLQKMLIMEGIFYSGLALTVSYILSIFVVGIGVKAYAAVQYTMTYHFTLTALIICTPILVLLSIIIPLICYRNINKKSIVERLRETE